MDSQVFRHFKVLFSIFGFEPITKNAKLTNYCWLSFHCVFAVLQLILIIIYYDVIMYTYDEVGEVSDVIKFQSIFCAYFAAIYVSWINTSFGQNPSVLVKNLEILMEKFHVNINEVHKKCHKNLKQKFFFLIMTHFISIVQTVVYQRNETQSIRFACTFTLPFVFCYMKQFQEIMHIELVNHYFEVLNDELKKLNELITCNDTILCDKKYSEFLFKRLKLCKNFYAILFELKELGNSRKGSIIFINQINFHIHILSSLYWTTFRIFNQLFDPKVCKKKIKNYLITKLKCSSLSRQFNDLSFLGLYDCYFPCRCQ